MSWPWYTAAVLAAISLITAIMLLPLRIFVSYLRNNNKGAMTLRIGVAGWRFKLPERLLMKQGRQKARVARKGALFELRETWRAIKPFQKKFICTHCILEARFGFGDAALDGMAAGAAWAVAGTALGLSHRFFQFKTRPRISFVPLFTGNERNLRFEGEISAPVYRYLALMLSLRKIGGASGGKTSN